MSERAGTDIRKSLPQLKKVLHLPDSHCGHTVLNRSPPNGTVCIIEIIFSLWSSEYSSIKLSDGSVTDCQSDESSLSPSFSSSDEDEEIESLSNEILKRVFFRARKKSWSTFFLVQFYFQKRVFYLHYPQLILELLLPISHNWAVLDSQCWLVHLHNSPQFLPNIVSQPLSSHVHWSAVREYDCLILEFRKYWSYYQYSGPEVHYRQRQHGDSPPIADGFELKIWLIDT